MFFSDKSDLVSLAFIPRNKCFSKAQIEWRGVVLNGKFSENKPIVDLSEEDLEDLVYELFGKLSFIELSELYLSISDSDLSQHMNWESYFKKVGMHFSQRNTDLFSKINKLPELFKAWAFDRKLSAADLMPINSLSNLDVFSSLSSLFSELKCSRNDGKRILDILADLILMGKNREELVPLDGQDWLKCLYQQRYPETLKKDSKLSSLDSWPEFVQIQNKRTGDSLSYNMKIQYTDQKDLSQKLNRLSEMSLEQ